jgi:hypothetical protein
MSCLSGDSGEGAATRTAYAEQVHLALTLPALLNCRSTIDVRALFCSKDQNSNTPSV